MRNTNEVADLGWTRPTSHEVARFCAKQRRAPLKRDEEMIMTKSWMKKAIAPVAILALMTPVLAQCGAGLPGGIPGVDGIPGAAKCPDMSNPDAIAEFDWAANYKVDAATQMKLKGGITAAVELKMVADQIDADLKVGCGGLAKDLGSTEDFKSGEDACKAAIKIVGEVKAKLGAHASASLDIEPPKCGAEMSLVADCAAKCDANLTPGSAKVECEPGKLQGECSAMCEGTCEVSGGAKCEGDCSGKCDAKMTGRCDGNCDGTCDGKPSKATCTGKCDGKCDAQISGSCSGSCSGGCKLKAKAECKGTCSGSCSVEMKAPRCTGEVKPPQMSAECKAHCDAKAEAKVTCTPARVGARIDGGADAALQAKFKMALEKNFPIIAKIALGLAPRAVKLVGNVQEIVTGLQSTVQGAASAGGVTGAQLVGCVAAPFKGVGDAAASLQANAKVSVDVKASAEFHGSGSGSASTK